MPFSQTDLDAINQAIASKALRVRFADREIEYKSEKDLLAARTAIINDLNGQNGTQTRRQIRIYTSKGL